GAWAIGGAGWLFSWSHQDDDASISAIHAALDAGMNWIDTAAVCAVVAAALPGALPYHQLIGTSAEAGTLALLPLWWLQEALVSPSTIGVVVVVAAAALALVFLTVSPRYALVLPALVFLWFAFATERIERFDHGFPKASVGALFQGMTTARRDWIDAAVG